MAADGANFVAVTDKAHWVRGRIVYRGAAPTGIADAEIAPMLGAGRPPADGARMVRHRIARRR